jgi:hypothetical protein
MTKKQEKDELEIKLLKLQCAKFNVERDYYFNVISLMSHWDEVIESMINKRNVT